MVRSIPFILLALAEVGIKGPQAETYAHILQEEGKKRNFDPVTVVVLIAGESGGRASVVNSQGCVGLGQICLSNFPYCQKGKSYDKARCDAKKARLQSGPVNLRHIAAAISSNREFCNRKTGKRGRTRNQWRHWLPSYGGYNAPSKGVWCGQKKVKGKWVNVPIPKRVQQYMAKRVRIIKAVQRKMRKR